MAHSGSLLHYLGSFILYTLLAIGVIYAVYCYARKHSGNLFLGVKKSANPKARLEIESVLALEARKNLYVVRSGHERFLVATSMEGTQFLSRLESADAPAAQALRPEAPQAQAEPTVQPPWYTQPEALPEEPRQDELGKSGATKPGEGFGARFAQSLQWLVASRTRLS
jgi:flagellar biogenesis protein FliO